MKPATGFAAERWQVNWTKPIVLFRESDVRYLEFSRIEWLRAPRQRL